MATLGTYYSSPTGPGFPAVIIKEIDAGRVLVRVWTDGGDMTTIATWADAPAGNTFVANA